MTAAFDTAFDTAAQALATAFGAPGLLRGSVAVEGVVISRSVAVMGDYGQVARRVDTAAFPAGTVVSSSDSLTIGSESWILDMPMDNSTGLPEFALRAAP